MPDLADLMRDAASQAGSRPVDIEAAMHRGDRLRLRRTVARASSPMLVVLALAIVLPRSFGDDTVKFLPQETPGAVASPQGEASPEPTEATPAPRSKQRRARKQDGTVLPVGGDRRQGYLASEELTTSAGSGASGAMDAGTGSSSGGGAGSGTHNEDPAAGPSTPREPGEEPPAEDPGSSYDPPPAEGCDIRWTDTPPGASTTCAYTATHAGGFTARKETPTINHPNPNSEPDYWEVEIRRGSQIFHYDNHDLYDCSDDAIQPGDVVTATVYRPASPEDAFSIDLLTGRNRSCTS